MKAVTTKRLRHWAAGIGLGWVLAAGGAAWARGEDGGALVLAGGTVLTEPGAAAVRDGIVLIEDGKIVAAGGRAEVAIPEGARVIDCAGQTVTAGFWNCHVHFTEPKWSGAEKQPAAELDAGLRAMLTSQGFTTAVDLASLLSNTVALRRRIESGEVTGPRILTAGLPLYPHGGVPYYVTESLPPEVVARMPAPATVAEALKVVDADVAGGADLIKLFAVTGVRDEKRNIFLRNMDVEIAKAATAEAHRLGKRVAVHPSNLDGVEIALAARVDILAHAIQDPENWTPALVGRLVEARIALVPTLTLFSVMKEPQRVYAEAGKFAEAGGRVLFGTDVGFLSDYGGVRREFGLMAKGGLSFDEILAALTTAPAAEFGLDDRSGKIAKGGDADLVVLDGQPEQGAALFARVSRTLRAGRVIYEAEP